ncbi:hypothetical protein DIPPA_06432 [Diplonema papillatum]|nr:hypothetical protein DIPPA_06432 [Diplonema papillatum]
MSEAAPGRGPPSLGASLGGIDSKGLGPPAGPGSPIAPSSGLRGDPHAYAPAGTLSVADTEGLPITQDALELRLQPAPTFTATSCPHCDNVFEVAIDFEEIKDHVEFERLKKKELEAQKEAYKQEITKFQEEVNSLKETLANLCNQLAQAQVENLRSKQASLEQDSYIKQLKEHLKQSEEELHHLAYDFEVALERNKELQQQHMRTTGQMPAEKYRSSTARKIAGGERPGTSGGGALPDAHGSTPGMVLGGSPAGQSRVAQIAPLFGGQRSPPGASGGGGGVGRSQDRYRQQLVQFYSVHNPAKISEVDAILREFAGHEEDMMVMLARKYCAPPLTSPGASAAGAATGGYASAPPGRYASQPSYTDDDEQLRAVAPWTLQMANSRRNY